MKKIFFALFLIPSLCIGQQKDTLFSIKNDRFTDKKTKSLKNPIWLVNKNKEKCYLDIESTDSSYTIYIKVFNSELHCTDDKEGEIFFLSEDGDKLQQRNSMRYNCDGVSILFIREGSASNLKLESFIRANTMQAIKISGIKGSAEFDFDKKSAKKFKEASTLLLENQF